jgi:hypothetical protein
MALVVPALHAIEQPDFDKGKDLHVTCRTALIAGHMSTFYDEKMVAKPAAQTAMAWARARGFPIIYLQDVQEEGYFYLDEKPDCRLYSAFGGMEDVDPANFSPRRIVLLGGYWDGCFNNTSKDSIEFMLHQRLDTKVVYVVPGIYLWSGKKMSTLSIGALTKEIKKHISDLGVSIPITHHLDVRIDGRTILIHPSERGHKVILDFVSSARPY